MLTIRTRRTRAGFSVIEVVVAIGILAILVGLIFAAVGFMRAKAEDVDRAAWLDQRRLGVQPTASGGTKPLRVLFIGNSYTATNDLPGTLQALVAASKTKPPIETDSVVVGGAKLSDHWDTGTAQAMIAGSKWDYVVLQEQSQTPLPAFGRDTLFYPSVRKFAPLIRENGGTPFLYMTWRRPDMSVPQSEWTQSYVGVTREVGAEICPAGVAVDNVLKAKPSAWFYADSGGHPTPAGTYLVACTFYSAIYLRSPVGLPASVQNGAGVAVGVDPADAPFVQKTAWDAAQQVRKLSPLEVR